MTWVAPPAFTSGNVLTAAQMNILSGDLNETAAAQASTAGQYFVSTGANTLAARAPNRNTINVAESLTSTSYVNLSGSVGPTINSFSAGTSCLCLLQAKVSHGTALGNAYMALQVSGASSIAPDDEYALGHAPGAASGFIQCTFAILYVAADGWTAGTNTVQAKYRVNTGTGSWDFRRVTVIPY